MTTLRQNFIRELVLRGMSPRTQTCYVRAIYEVSKHYHQSPDQLSDDQLKDYLFYLASERHLAASSMNQRGSALRGFYHWVLHRSVDHLREVMPRVHREIRRPEVFSAQELERLFIVGCVHRKHRAF